MEFVKDVRHVAQRASIDKLVQGQMRRNLSVEIVFVLQIGYFNPAKLRPSKFFSIKFNVPNRTCSPVNAAL